MPSIGIMAALHDEIAVFLEAMGPDTRTQRIGLRDYYLGRISGRECVVVLARVGKVAAAATAVTLIRESCQGFVSYSRSPRSRSSLRISSSKASRRSLLRRAVSVARLMAPMPWCPIRNAIPMPTVPISSNDSYTSA